MFSPRLRASRGQFSAIRSFHDCGFDPSSTRFIVIAPGDAGGVVAQKPALGRASALQVTTFGCLVGAVVCLPFAGQLVRDAAEAPVSATLNMLYLGVFPTALAFTTWAYALARTTASRMGATTYAVPALVVVMSWLALGEVPAV